MYDKYTELRVLLNELYPDLNVFIDDNRLVIEKHKKEILTYESNKVIFANLILIPDALNHIKDYDLLRNIDE